MTPDPIAAFKEHQKKMWASFSPTATFTTPVAAQLVDFAGVKTDDVLLDAGTGTGVVAITAKRLGATVSALDLTETLLDCAKENEAIAACGAINWQQGDIEQLPYPDASFNVVLSQFAHIFAPRPDVAMAEIHRVLKPGGIFAFAAWPPEQLVGRTFGFVGRNSPPPPPGVQPPVLWGNEQIVRERLSAGFTEPHFDRRIMTVPALSLGHFRLFMEQSIGPIQKLMQLHAEDTQKLIEFRAELDSISADYYKDNLLNQQYLLARARKK